MRTLDFTSSIRKSARPLAALAVAGCLTLLSVIGVRPAHAYGTPFDPEKFYVMLAQAEPASPQCGGPGTMGTQLFQGVQMIDNEENVTVEYFELGDISCVQYNAIGFDPVDGYIYGVASNSYGGVRLNEVVRIDALGDVVGTGRVLPASDSGQKYNIGAYMPTTGELIVSAGCGAGTNEYYTIPLTDDDLSPITVDTVGVPVKHLMTRGENVPNDPKLLPNLADWVLHDDYIWGVSTNDTATPSGHWLYRLDPVSGVLSRSALPAGFNDIGRASFGGQWMYGNGNLGLSDNETGMIYQVRLTNANGTPYTGGSVMPTVQFVGQPIQGRSVKTGLVMASSGNDGTSTTGLPDDLAVIKKVSVNGSTPDDIAEFSPQADPADVITYTLEVTNHSPNNVSSGWVLDDPIPTGLIITDVTVDSSEADSGASCSITPTEVFCDGSAGLQPGQSIYITLTGTASGNEPIVNVATLTGNDADPHPEDNVSQATLVPSAGAGSTTAGEAVLSR